MSTTAGREQLARMDFSGAVNFSQDDDAELTGFDVLAYSGAVVERHWGRLVVDIAGIQARQAMPVFLNHVHSDIVGHSTSFSKGAAFRIKGVFSKSTRAAAEVKALAKEAFPWQASIGVKPLKITEIASGEALTVNGRPVQGPAEVWTESEVHETSFVPLGADSDTSAAVFANGQGSRQPLADPLYDRWKSMTLEERTEYAGEFGIFRAYHTHYEGVAVKATANGRGCTRIQVTPSTF